MNRQISTLASFVALLAFASVGRGQDIGKFLEKSSKEFLNPQLAPDNGQRPLSKAEVHTIVTTDGWMLVVHRYRPTGPAAPGALPVILCHGLGYNALFWDLDPSCSFPDYLSRQGFDVWSASLRGCGLSRKWVWKLDSTPSVLLGGAVRRLTGGQLAPTGYATVDPTFANWTLDDHITHDVAALVHLVRRRTGAREVAWVGHSMGGIVALGHLCRYQNPGIGKLVTVGSQLTMPQGQLFGQFCVETLRTRQLQFESKLDTRQRVQETHKSMHNLFFNEQHVKPEVYEALATWANDVPSIGLMQQYLVLSRTGELLDSRKEFSYTRNLMHVQVPILITGGGGDQLAPPAVQRFLHDNISSRNKSLIIFGRAQGFAVDAGHNDTLVGLTSRQQVYPTIERWLRTP